ncbi:hypothetical protein VNO77_21243 [Canavalia gladiata]|uniref:Uncharacterized protein n=1 Tax=Canavalia gladiata TaxID=3824 RepID=A0AAN9LVB1_CANGL
MIRFLISHTISSPISLLFCALEKLVPKQEGFKPGIIGVRKMAMAKFFVVLILALIAISMLQTMVMASNGQGDHLYDNKSKYGPGSLKSYQCPSQCSRRCSKTQYHKPCMFFCQKCCRKCLCVPPGYYGNKAVCPCYNNWKTKEGGPKCP